jgi:hypothetical protein
MYGLGRCLSLPPNINLRMSTDISSAMTTKSSRADRDDRDFQRSEIQIQTPESRDCTQLPVHKRSVFQVRTPEARDCSQLPVHAQAPAPSTSLHHSAHRQVSLQFFHSGQICRPWRRQYASQYSCEFQHRKCLRLLHDRF